MGDHSRMDVGSSCSFLALTDKTKDVPTSRGNPSLALGAPPPFLSLALPQL